MDEKKTSKAERIYNTWKHGMISQLKKEDTFIIGIGVGIYQGLKYNGNVNRGIKAGLATMLTISVSAGVMNVTQNWDRI